MNILILGAGPAGLTLGNRLKDKGVDAFTILEKESEAGGLCRTVMVDGVPVDIGGPHFLDDRDPKVVDYLFRFLPKKDWDYFERNSKIMMPDGQIIGSPIEANIWQLKREDQVDYLEAISQAGCNMGKPMPEDYVEWVYWKLGSKIAENYMLPYNAKLYGDNVSEMGTYWLYKLPNVSFRETIMSCLDRKFYGRQPCQAMFYYTKYGYGEVWKRMAENIASHIRCNSAVEAIDMDTRTVTTVNGERYPADVIVTTVPWTTFKKIDGMPAELAQKVRELKATSVEVRYVEKALETDAQWMYCAGPQLPYHRLTLLENLVRGAHGMLVETRKERLSLYKEGECPSRLSYMNEYAYPVHTIQKPQIMSELLAYSKGKKVYGLGRWGEHQQHNSDVTVDLAMRFADELIG